MYISANYSSNGDAIGPGPALGEEFSSRKTPWSRDLGLFYSLLFPQQQSAAESLKFLIF